MGFMSPVCHSMFPQAPKSGAFTSLIFPFREKPFRDHRGQNSPGLKPALAQRIPLETCFKTPMCLGLLVSYGESGFSLGFLYIRTYSLGSLGIEKVCSLVMKQKRIFKKLIKILWAVGNRKISLNKRRQRIKYFSYAI